MKEVTKVIDEANVNYFADKIAKRMKDFALYGKALPMESRGETCLDEFRKNSDRRWSQRFFLLNLGSHRVTLSAGITGLLWLKACQSQKAARRS